MINLRIVKVLSIAVLIIALAIVTSVLLSQSESQAMPPDVKEQNQVTEEQVSPQDKATATITITMTTILIPSDDETQPAKD